MSNGFCSKFHRLSSSANILKMGYDMTKLLTVYRWELFFETQCSSLVNKYIHTFSCRVAMFSCVLHFSQNRFPSTAVKPQRLHFDIRRCSRCSSLFSSSSSSSLCSLLVVDLRRWFLTELTPFYRGSLAPNGIGHWTLDRHWQCRLCN